MLGRSTHRWDLTAEAIALKIRWFGLIVGIIIADWPTRQPRTGLALHGILAIGLLYTLLETLSYRRHRIFMGRWPLLCGLLEAIYIFFLCWTDTGPDSPFRHFYLLSLVLAAVRHALWVPYVTCLMHASSFGLLLWLDRGHGGGLVEPTLFMVIMVWVTWSATALALLLKRAGGELQDLNAELQAHQALLEDRIAERTRALEEIQAQAVHQERRAALGLLAAGVAHEIGNPLAALSGLVQTLQRQEWEPSAALNLQLMGEQIERMRGTLRELLDFSRTPSNTRSWVSLAEVVQEARQIAKYCARRGARHWDVVLEPNLPPIWAAREALVQAVLNLLMNALDATEAGGRIILAVVRSPETGGVDLLVADDGTPIPPELATRLFQPQVTTKPHGTGLGLFITRKLLADQGAEIDYQPAGAGPTAGLKTFRLRFPRALIDVQPSQQTESAVATASPHSRG
jgi:two-component system NtrC family sensor kinase